MFHLAVCSGREYRFIHPRDNIEEEGINTMPSSEETPSWDFIHVWSWLAICSIESDQLQEYGPMYQTLSETNLAKLIKNLELASNVCIGCSRVDGCVDSALMYRLSDGIVVS